MDTHPSYPALSPLIKKYPKSAGSLFQAYNDIVYVQKWTDIMLVELEECERGAIKGKKSDVRIQSSQQDILHVVPCTLAETVSFGWLQSAFQALLDPPEIYLAITSDDSSIVYYKISRGIVKPPL